MRLYTWFQELPSMHCYALPPRYDAHLPTGTAFMINQSGLLSQDLTFWGVGD